MKTKTLPRIDIEKEMESISGLFSDSILNSSILVVYQLTMNENKNRVHE